jgi:hypothetical protein
MSPDQRAAARARCAAATGDYQAFADLMMALDAIDAADRRISDLEALVHRLAERVHSQSEKLSRRAEKQPVT